MPQAVPSTPWKGSFTPIAFTHVLKRVAHEGRSGELRIVSGNWVKTIGLDGGSVRSAQSNMRQDRLGESMLAHDFISEEDFDNASERMRSDGCRFGEALVRMGRLDQSSLHRSLAVQTQRIVLSLFRVDEGLYSFDEMESPELRMPFSLSVPPLLLKGLRRLENGRLLLEQLPPADARVRRCGDPWFSTEKLKLNRVERSLLELAGDGASLGSLVRESGLERGPALRSCYALLQVGLLERVNDDERADGDLDEKLRERIDRAYGRLEEMAEEELLGVSTESTENTLRTAYKTVSTEWASLRSRTTETELLEKIDAITFRLAAAFHQQLVARERGGDGSKRRTERPTGRVAQLVRDARMHMAVQDTDGALSLIGELVELEPDKASSHVLLGQAKLQREGLRKSAEESFLRAVDLAPEDADVQFALARFYQETGQSGKATATLVTVLALDPEHEGANSALEAQPEPSTVQKFLGKIFRSSV